jgi:hypothetical protein
MWAAVTMAVLSGCAAPDDTSGDSPSSAASVMVPHSAGLSPPVFRGQPGGAACVDDATSIPAAGAKSGAAPSDADERARRALQAQQHPTPRRSGVPEAAIPGAEACVQILRRNFALLTTGFRTVPDQPAVDTALRSADLTRIVVRDGPAFAGSTGAACLYGTFTGTGLDFVIGPPAVDGSCPP